MIQQEIVILKQLKKKRPWSGGYEVKKEKFTWFLEELCKLHELEIPKLIIHRSEKQFKWAKKYCGDCTLEGKKGQIRIKNFSIITLLHEFKHWKDFHDPELKFNKKEEKKREYDAYYYSTRRFYAVWPERIKMLSEFIENKIFKTKSIQTRIRKMKNKYKEIDMDYILKAETCAIIDIILGEFLC